MNLKSLRKLDARNDMENENISHNEKKNSVFFLDVARGVGIGTAFIIPGFSGGSIAAILGIYEKLVGAIADIFKDFKKSFMTILPIFIGMVIGIVSLIFPLSYFLEEFPLPTVSLFVGLAIGGMPSVTDNMKGRVKITNAVALTIPLLFALSLSFIPVSEDVDFFSLNFGGYALLFIVGIIGSTALIVPGISGSMLLLIFGYYNPILRLATDHLLRGRDVLVSIGVLATVGVGIIVGFIAISVIMKKLLERYKRGTYFAICGFIVGSLPSVFISTAKEAGYTLATLPSSAWHWVACALMLILGFALSFGFVILAKKKGVSE